jgi:serine/threonine protein kinase
MSEPNAPALGTILNGEYILEEKLGEGSARVFRARRQREGRHVAVRIVWPGTPLLAAEFRELAGAASRIRHPILSNVESFGRYGAEACFIVSEYVQGQRLDDWADAIGIPPLAQVVELVRRLCIGLQAAARGGVTHDALNPRNIIVLSTAQPGGTRMPVKLLDLGVPALLFAQDTHDRSVRYMAPEQLAVLAAAVRPVSFRCTPSMNVYSCGCLLYYLCTGGPPYPGVTVEELLAAHASGRLVPPVRINPQISPTLNALIVRTLALDPSDRFGSVAELAEALASAPGSVALHSRSSRAPESPRTQPPLSISPVAAALSLDDPPTFKTPRPTDLLLLQRARESEPSAESNDKPTLPPLSGQASEPPPEAAIPTPPPAALSLPMPEAGAAVAPIGLFSSAPPDEERRSTAPPAYLSERPAPLALFSTPPAAGSSQVERSDIIVAEAEPIASRLVGPYQDFVARRARRKRRWLFDYRLWALAAVICLGTYIGVRSMSPSEPLPVQPLDARGPAAISGETKHPRPPPTAAVAPARSVAPTAAAPAAIEAPASAPPASAANEIPVLERLHERDHEHEHEHVHAHATRGAPATTRATGNAESNAAAAREEPFPLAPPAPAPAPSASEAAADAAANHARPSVITVLPALDAKQAPDVQAASPVVRAHPTGNGAPLPLSARAQIESVEVRGSLPTSQVRRAVERIRPQFEACYARSAQVAGHNGFAELIVELQIDERGRARAPRVRGGSLPRLEACVAEVAAKLISEKAPDTGTVNASFRVAFTP